MANEQIVGLGDRFYRVERTPVRLPEGYSFGGISDVAVFNGQVVALRRQKPQLLILSLDGELVKTIMLEGVILGHGIRALGADMMAVTDIDGHQVLLLDASFRVLHRLHCNNRPRLGQPFNHPTDCARDSKGCLYVSDGYGNSQIHVFTAELTYSHSFGGAGSAEGKFSTPHSVAVLAGNRVAVADRENNRVQIFSSDGDFLSSITGVHKPMALDVYGGLIYVTDQTPRLSVFSADGELLGRCRTFSTYGHGLAQADNGSIYIADMIPDGLTKLEPLD
uniref:hypothetical protein n=1 Tax=Marinobacterium profundum TaxID=1714300 RepID=UPI00082AEC9F|nr:hypothetical protein [Marinobacterium profundum]